MTDQICKVKTITYDVYFWNIYVYIYIYEFDYPKRDKAEITLHLTNHNVSEKLILPVTKIAEAINYKWLPRKQIQEERVSMNSRKP